jgi:hypothetical protein
MINCMLHLFRPRFGDQVIHTGAHLVNAVNCSLYYNHRWIEVNIAKSPGQDPFQLVFNTRNDLMLYLPRDI